MKLVKTYLRNSICHEGLSHLALLSIESTRAESIDLEQFVDEFDSRHDKILNYTKIEWILRAIETIFEEFFILLHNFFCW